MSEEQIGWYWGVDVGMRKAGSVIAAVAPGQAPKHFTVPTDDSQELAQRLAEIEGQAFLLAHQLAHDCPPVSVRIERQTGTYIKPRTHYAAGAMMIGIHKALLEVHPFAVPITEVSPGTWKKQAIGHGNATKDEVMRWALGTIAEDACLTQDQADAIAIAASARVDDLGT